MTFSEKMLEHIQRAEEADLLASEIHAVVDREVTRRYGARIGRLSTTQERQNQRQFYLNGLLAENHWYGKATGNRNYHAALAQMYGTAALVEITRDDQVIRP
jgi:hypothetical protein